MVSEDRLNVEAERLCRLTLAEEIRAESSLPIWPEDFELALPDIVKVLLVWFEVGRVAESE